MLGSQGLSQCKYEFITLSSWCSSHAREAPGSKMLVRPWANLTYVSRDFFQSRQETFGTVPLKGHDHYLPKPLTFIIHLLSSQRRYMVCYTDSVVKYDNYSPLIETVSFYEAEQLTEVFLKLLQNSINLNTYFCKIFLLPNYPQVFLSDTIHKIFQINKYCVQGLLFTHSCYMFWPSHFLKPANNFIWRVNFAKLLNIQFFHSTFPPRAK
jgi:hypothetical protein